MGTGFSKRQIEHHYVVGVVNQTYRYGWGELSLDEGVHSFVGKVVRIDGGESSSDVAIWVMDPTGKEVKIWMEDLKDLRVFRGR